MKKQVNNIVTVPVAVAKDNFKWMIQFFDYQHRKVYGDKALSKCIVPIIKRNFRHEPKIEDVDWGLKVPYKMVDGIYDMGYDIPDGDAFMPLNLYAAIVHVIDDLNDDDYIEIIDSDMFHLRPFSSTLPGDNEINADDRYENWHMFVNSKNRYVIEKYLKHNDEGYMNGGSNIVGKVKVVKKLLPEIIDVAIDIVKTAPDHRHRWWSCMFSTNVACHNQRIKMVSKDDCYYPPGDGTIPGHKHMVHYSTDPIFDKRKFPNIDVTAFKDNLFYNSAKEFMSLYNYIR